MTEAVAAAKVHLPVLDGLRGIAAISVVVFHCQELTVAMTQPDALWLRHAYLAVDFFYCLSGYVIGYAYDGRRATVGIKGFCKARLIRLHPLILMGAFLGLLSYAFDPFSGYSKVSSWAMPQQAAHWKLTLGFLGAMLLFPTPALPNRFGSFISLNLPSWSLMWEYAASLAYALLLWRLPNRALVAITVVAAACVVLGCHHANMLAQGPLWGETLYGVTRVTFSFGAGLLLFRSRLKVPSPFGFVLLSLALLAVFILPGYGNSESGKVPLNWVYDSVTVILVFPLLVALAASAKTTGVIARICAVCGRLSYPIYILHYAIVIVFINYSWKYAIAPKTLPWVIGALTILIALFSYVVLVLYDEPIRSFLTQRFLRRTSPAQPDEAGALSASSGLGEKPA